MENLELYIKIEDYLSNQMSEAERSAFELEMKSNEFIYKEVKMYEQINSIVLDSHIADVSQSIKHYHTKTVIKNNTIKTVAIIGLIVFISSWVVFTFLKPNKASEPNKVETPEEQSLIDALPVKPKVVTSNKQKSDVVTTTDNKQISIAHSVNEIIKIESMNNQNHVHTNTTDLTQSNHSQINNTNKIASVNPCDQTNIQVEYTTHGTCFNKQEGEIRILKITGGESPYITHVYNDQHKEFDRTNLKHGNYSLHIIDQNNCNKVYNHINIEALNCKLEYVFNPTIGEIWNIPIYSSAGQLQIVNQNGVVVYKNTLQANEQEMWNGTSLNGNIEHGLHSFIIQYKDGHVLQGTITIVE